jgi:ribosome-associated translation inhibitor RaiA
MELTPSMKVLAEKKLITLLGHIQQRSREEANIRVVMNKAQEPDKLLVKVEAKVEGKAYFGNEADYTLESALIKAIDEVDKQYLKEKEKAKDRDWEKNREFKRFDGGEIGTEDNEESAT